MAAAEGTGVGVAVGEGLPGLEEAPLIPPHPVMQKHITKNETTTNCAKAFIPVFSPIDTYIHPNRIIPILFESFCQS
jgi:hypothetical protein